MDEVSTALQRALCSASPVCDAIRIEASIPGFSMTGSTTVVFDSHGMIQLEECGGLTRGLHRFSVRPANLPWRPARFRGIRC